MNQIDNIVRCQFQMNHKEDLHFHSDTEILYVLDGKLTLKHGEKETKMEAEDFMLINSKVRHEYIAEEKVMVGKLYIDYSELCKYFDGNTIYFLCSSADEKIETVEKLRYLIRQIFNYSNTKEGQGIMLQKSISYELMYLLTSFFCVKKGMGQYDSLRGIKDERMNDIMSYLMMNYQKQITLHEVAEMLYLTPTYLAKYMKKNFGMNFLRLLNNIRMEHAVNDLTTSSQSIIKIALDNGFPNISAFNHVFKESIMKLRPSIGAGFRKTPVSCRQMRKRN